MHQSWFINILTIVLDMFHMRETYNMFHIYLYYFTEGFSPIFYDKIFSLTWKVGSIGVFIGAALLMSVLGYFAASFLLGTVPSFFLGKFKVHGAPSHHASSGGLFHFLNPLSWFEHPTHNSSHTQTIPIKIKVNY